MSARFALIASALALAACAVETKYVYPDDLGSANYMRRTQAAQEFVERGDSAEAERAFALLDDERVSLRAMMHVALRDLSEGEDFGYRPGLSEQDRVRVARRWQGWFQERFDAVGGEP